MASENKRLYSGNQQPIKGNELSAINRQNSQAVQEELNMAVTGLEGNVGE
jgi:hypothetical protein